MKRYLLLLFIMTYLVGCSNSVPQFDDKNIKIRLVQHQSNELSDIYVVEIKNSGDLEINHLDFYLSYPILHTNGSKGNPFKVEGRTVRGKPISLKAGASIVYTIEAPIKEVFGDSKLLDFSKPSVELDGFVLTNNEEIPFTMIGDYLHTE